MLLSPLWLGYLQIWDLYSFGPLNELFGYIQQLAYSAALSLIIKEQHYTRAAAFESLQMSDSYVLAPAVAGALYVIAELIGVLVGVCSANNCEDWDGFV